MLQAMECQCVSCLRRLRVPGWGIRHQVTARPWPGRRPRPGMARQRLQPPRRVCWPERHGRPRRLNHLDERADRQEPADGGGNRRQRPGQRWASPEPARPGRSERRSGRQVSQRQLEPAVTGQGAVGPVRSQSDGHRTDDRQRPGGIGGAGHSEQAATELGRPGERGHLPARRQADPLEPGRRLLQPRTAEGAEQFLSAMDGQVPPTTTPAPKSSVLRITCPFCCLADTCSRTGLGQRLQRSAFGSFVRSRGRAAVARRGRLGGP
jgi:hypothetical protein